MNTYILFYKIYEGKDEPVDYWNWAFKMIESEFSSPSLYILSSLTEPLNIFEVKDYFNKAVKELRIEKPTQEECAKYLICNLLSRIIEDQTKAIDYAYEVYKLVREHFINEELDIWYEISEMIDDFRYGDNIENITMDLLTSKIIQEAKKQIQKNNFSKFY